MELEHTFTVPAPVDTVWDALLDLEQVIPCFPGAALTSRTGEEFTGTVKVKLGPVSLLYKGKGKFLEIDEGPRRVVIDATGRDSRGSGTASAKVTATLRESDDGGTHATVVTDMNVTGKPAQLGRGLINEVAGKIMNQFADCLAVQFAPAQASDPAMAEIDTAASPGGGNGAAPDGAAPAVPSPAASVAAGAGSPGGAASPAEPAELAVPATVTPTTAAPEGGVAAGQRTARGRRPAPAAGEIDLLGTAGAPVLKRLAPALAVLLVLVLVLRRLRQR